MLSRRRFLAGFQMTTMAAASDWPRFRGPDGAGVSPDAALPQAIAPGQNRLWSVEVAQGASSPVSNGTRVFLTGFGGEERSVVCLDAASGRRLWSRSFRRRREEAFHKTHGPATPTPALAGGRLFAFFPDIGLVALDREGREVWSRPLGPFRSVQGLAASPVAVEGLVVVLVDTPEEAYVAAFDQATGKETWRANRPTGVLGGYATPVVWQRPDGGTQVIVPGARELTGYQAATGERVWWGPGITAYPMAPPFVANGFLYTSEPVGVGWPPFSEPLQQFDKDGDGKISLAEAANDPSWLGSLRGIDRNAGDNDGVVTREEYAKGSVSQDGGMYKIRLGGKGDISGTHVEWRRARSVPSFSGALLYQDVLYTVRRGILTAQDPATGNVLREARLPGALGEYYASPIAGDGKIYLASYEGVVTVVQAGRDWQVLSTGDLGEAIVATPAIASSRVFVRSAGKLHCFGRGES